MTEESSAAASEQPAAAPRKYRPSRRLTFWRVQGYRVAALFGYLVLEVLWRTCRIQIIGQERMQQALNEQGVVVPVCWHQHLLLCSRFIARSGLQNFRPGALISPSVDGESPSMLARLYGVEVIRGSSTHTGPQAARALYKVIQRQGISPLMTPDGPRGPRFEFKAGAIGIAQLSGVPIIPMAYAARSAKVFSTWDKFILPRPFTRIVFVLGEPYLPPRKVSAEEMLELQKMMAARMQDAYRQARALLDQNN